MKTKPLLLECRIPLPRQLRFYLYSVTQHASERQVDTFKIQLTSGNPVNGESGKRFTFDRTGGIRPILIGYHADLRVFILWDAELHDAQGGFAFSSSCQAPPDLIYSAVTHGLAIAERPLKRLARTEEMLASRPERLIEAIEKRIALSNKSLLDGVV
ncbi:hypothetical protein [Streptosporangium jomthongense]|uniref:Methylase-associated X1 domain-containing protein n=1 Tax=Streptosporangium jomthongense TaxID=1193683 RepID=A0ABV8F215_9ACTN